VYDFNHRNILHLFLYHQISNASFVVDNPRYFLLKCMYQVRKLSGHVFVCWGYQFCISQQYFSDIATVLLVEETGVYGENTDVSQITDKCFFNEVLAFKVRDIDFVSIYDFFKLCFGIDLMIKNFISFLYYICFLFLFVFVLI
jgi:hypothetical protein